MTKIGVISDTHGLLRPQVLNCLENCNLIFHAGDFSDTGTYETLSGIAPLYAVRGNNDWSLPNHLKTFRAFQIEGVNIALVHNKRDLPILSALEDTNVIIFGHSHQYYEELIGNQLWLNPGSCGHRRFGGDLTMAFLFVDEGSFQVQRMDIDL